MLFCLKDGDAFPTEALGLPSRLIPEPIQATAAQSARWDFERLCHSYPDGSFPFGDGQKLCPVPLVGDWAIPSPGEPPVPGPADREIHWAPIFRFHSKRIGGIAYETARKQIVRKLQGAKPTWPDLYQFLQTLRSIPSP